MAGLSHVDGDLVPAAEASVSVHDRGFLYGDAVFETLRIYGGAVFRWDDHAERLARSAAALSLDHGLSSADLRRRVAETLRANGLDNALVRLSITRGVGSGGLSPDPDADPTVVVHAESLPRGGVGSDPVRGGPATLQTVKTRRVPDAAIPSEVKTHNHINAVLARLELRVSGADEAVMLDGDGRLAEGTTSALFFVDGNALCTPSLDGPVLPGVTRAEVIDIAEGEGIPVTEGSFTPEDLRSAEEAFVTTTTRGIRPVGTVDGIDVGAGPVTALLRRVYNARIERECYGGERLSGAGGSTPGDSEAGDGDGDGDGDADS
ncbi:4-amino-4-deoxychorismate lyase [Halobellus salinus]|uniref:4-amino-4-deoxychorismate lyase n=1 Tax=Halobellus salinus TaxID=931585 RepID=A0A830E802_9EURY|nr:aminotransferase class IV [Halobellus salinus]GGJ00724.1 4-amino-4-deoxychorismate lyase [Halobellus salinus]SMP01260.1 branched chain amino acid aminotransferase apoenzyme [Halobellus salinus]